MLQGERRAGRTLGVGEFRGRSASILKLEIYGAIGIDRVENSSVLVTDIVREFAGVSISLEGRNDRAAQGRQGFSHRLCGWLGVHLAIALDDLSMESGDDIGVIHGGMVMVAERGRAMATLRVDARGFRTIGFFGAEDWVAVERIGDGFSGSDHRLQVKRRDVVVVIIRAPAVSTPLVKFADFVGNLSPVVARVEYGNAIDSQRDCAAQKAVFHGNG